jgi:hypothetical protein
MHPTASASVLAGIALVSLSVVALLIAGYARAARLSGASPWPLAIGLLAWVGGTGALAATGALTHWEARPPAFVVLAVVSIAATFLLARSRVGARLAQLPLWLLVAFEGFRVPLELVMHAASNEGTMPVQMTYTGWNFDILSGASALVLAFALRRGASEKLAWAFSVLGLGLLAAIVAIAVVSTPVIAAFGPHRLNTWIAYFPFVWMITVNVPAALLGHLVVLRRLGSTRATPAPIRGIVALS